MTPMTFTVSARRGRGGSARSPCAPCPGPPEPWALGGVDVQQRPGLGPFVSPRALRAFGASLTTDAMTLQHLPARRAMPAGEPRQAHRPPVRLGAGIEDDLLLLAAERPRTRTAAPAAA